mmetsp:Transcript_132979/g.425301  ORF Transcript_132979/g.425301 Transcript_132979/m.425301 type:complete len:399 (+) Transcript_132979:1337-2533(+)
MARRSAAGGGHCEDGGGERCLQAPLLQGRRRSRPRCRRRAPLDATRSKGRLESKGVVGLTLGRASCTTWRRTRPILAILGQGCGHGRHGGSNSLFQSFADEGPQLFHLVPNGLQLRLCGRRSRVAPLQDLSQGKGGFLARSMGGIGLRPPALQSFLQGDDRLFCGLRPRPGLGRIPRRRPSDCKVLRNVRRPVRRLRRRPRQTRRRSRRGRRFLVVHIFLALVLCICYGRPQTRRSVRGVHEQRSAALGGDPREVAGTGGGLSQLREVQFHALAAGAELHAHQGHAAPEGEQRGLTVSEHALDELVLIQLALLIVLPQLRVLPELVQRQPEVVGVALLSDADLLELLAQLLHGGFVREGLRELFDGERPAPIGVHQNEQLLNHPFDLRALLLLLQALV